MDKQTILVVDDLPDNIAVLRGVLQHNYKIKAALNGQQALTIASSANKPDIILLDVMMPEMDGHQVCLALKENPVTAKIPVIFITAKDQVEDETQGLALGAVDYISKPINPAIVLARVQTHLALSNQQRELEKQVQQRTIELEDSRLEVIRRLGRAAEYKDNETGLHVIRMSWYARFLAEAMGANDDWVELLFKAAPMHDIGKIGIADSILLKPGKLDAEQWQEMQRHSQYGAKILGNNDHPLFVMAKEIALFHHEKWDGSGYPKGLKGEEIPLAARVVAITDVYDALTSERPYKKAWSEADALNLLQQEAGKHFDPALVPLFLQSMEKVRQIQQKYADSSALEQD